MKAGITGHQKLGSEETIKWILHIIEKTIIKYNIEQGLTSLAIGADQLYTAVLKKYNLPYTVIIPCNKYEETFYSQTDVKKFQELLQSASDVIKLEYDEPSESAFYEAGKLVVNLSDVIIAVWDGEPAKGLGGTADIVTYAISKGKSILHINPITRIIMKSTCQSPDIFIVDEAYVA